MADFAFVRPAGKTMFLQFAFTRPDANNVEQPVNLAGHTLRMTFKRSPADADADAVVQLGTDTDPTQFTISSPTSAGLCVAKLVPANTASVTGLPVVLYGDVQDYDGTDPQIGQSGTLVLTQPITRKNT